MPLASFDPDILMTERQVGSSRKCIGNLRGKEFNRWTKADSTLKYILNGEAFVKCMDQVFNPSLTYSIEQCVQRI